MSVIEAIKSRRSIKKFDPDYELTSDQLDQLMQLCTYCPTSFNLQNWRIVRVTDAELRKKIRVHSKDQPQATDASELFVICGDLLAWAKDPERLWVDASKERRDNVVKLIQNFYEGREWMQRDEVMRSGSLVAQLLILAAEELGLTSCPMIGFDQAEVANLIRLPKDHAIVMMLAIGKPAAPAYVKGSQMDVEYFFSENYFKL